MKTYELYLVTNNHNGKRYIGQTMSDIGYMNRWADHCAEAIRSKGHQCVFHSAIKGYGVDSFTVKRILKDISEKDIDRLESLWIQKLNTFYANGSGYNMTLGGQGVHGYKHTEESRKRISESLKKVPCYWTLELIEATERKKRENGFYEKRRKSNWRKNLSEATRRRFEHQPGTFAGKKHTEEAKRKVALARGAKIWMCDIDTGEELKLFLTGIDATKYLIETGRTTNTTANGRITEVCKGNAKTAYGYKWKYASSVTTSPDECKDVEGKMSYPSKRVTLF